MHVACDHGGDDRAPIIERDSRTAELAPLVIGEAEARILWGSRPGNGRSTPA